MENGEKDSRIRIGLMHLAHETYWKYFPQHEKPTMDLARVFTKFIAGFGAVLETGKLVDSRARAREARLLFQEKDADVIVLATATYSTPDDVILELKRFVRPVVVWNTQKSAAIPRDLDFDKWMLEHGITGVPGITNLLEREGIPYFLISGHHTRVREAFEIVFGAARAFGRIWGARIGMVGHLYPGMIDFGYDPTSMYTTFGAATVPVLEPVLSKAFDDVAERDVNALGDALSTRFAKAGDMTKEEYLQSVRTALAVKKVVEREALDAVTVYCQSLWQRPEMGVVPCLGMSLLMEEGVFCSCEGDVPTALAGMMLQSLSGSAFFTEIWCNDFENDQFMMGHSGTMNLGLFRSAPSGVKMVRHPWWTGCCGKGACLEVRMPPGRGTMMSLSQTRGSGWRMIVTTVEVVDRDPVPLGAPNFFIKLNKPIARYLEDLASLGAAHHFSMAYGDWTAHLKALAKILKAEYSPV